MDAAPTKVTLWHCTVPLPSSLPPSSRLACNDERSPQTTNEEGENMKSPPLYQPQKIFTRRCTSNDENNIAYNAITVPVKLLCVCVCVASHHTSSFSTSLTPSYSFSFPHIRNEQASRHVIYFCFLTVFVCLFVDSNSRPVRCIHICVLHCLFSRG